MKKLLAILLMGSLFASTAGAQTPVPTKKEAVKKTSVKKQNAVKKTVVTKKKTVTKKES